MCNDKFEYVALQQWLHRAGHLDNVNDDEKDVKDGVEDDVEDDWQLTRGNVEVALLLVKREEGKVHRAGACDWHPDDHCDDDCDYDHDDDQLW